MNYKTICEKCGKDIRPGKDRILVELSHKTEKVNNMDLPIQKQMFIFCDKCYDDLFSEIIKKRGCQSK